MASTGALIALAVLAAAGGVVGGAPPPPGAGGAARLSEGKATAVWQFAQLL